MKNIEFPEDFLELGHIARRLEEKGCSVQAACKAAPVIAEAKRWDDPLGYPICTSPERNPDLKGFDQIKWYEETL